MYMSLGDLTIQWPQQDCPFLLDDFITPYLIEDPTEAPSIVFSFQKTAMLPLAQGVCLEDNSLYERWQTPNGQLIVYHWLTMREAFSFYLEDLERDGEMTIYLNPKLWSYVPMDLSRFFSSAGLHAKLLRGGAMVLHCSYISANGKAILFTAPSQTGKSTQAELWRQAEGAEIINGDRALLRKRGDIWYAHGYPCAGSSGVSLNQSLPIESIVVLSQGSENQVKTITMGQRGKALFTGTEFYRWSQKEMDRVLEQITDLVTHVPVIHLNCRPDLEAVKVLKCYLKEEIEC